MISQVTFSPPSEVTIISITKNDPSGIRATVESIQSQDYKNWQLIIVVSGVTDSSIEYVKKLSVDYPNIRILIPNSQGIYQAMNYALETFSPSYVWFLNGGDKFASSHVLTSAVDCIIKEKAGVVIGGYRIVEREKSRDYVRKGRKISPRRFSLNIRSGNHQAMLFDFRRFSTVEFDLDFELAADFYFVLQVLNEGSGVRLCEIFVDIEPNGASSKEVTKVWAEKQKARQRFFGKRSFDYLLGRVWTIGVYVKWKAVHLL